MAFWPEFIGPSYRARSTTFAADVLINLFPEQNENASEAKAWIYYGTPGLNPFTEAATVRCRGMFSQDGVTVGVFGAVAYVLTAGAWVALGSLTDDGNPCSFASNGRGGEQIAMVGGGQLKIYDLLTGVLSASVVLPLTNTAQIIRFIDGYFILSETNTVRVWFSALEDGLSWDALDFFARSETSDNVIEVLRNRVWVFGSQTSEIFYDSGDADSPFVPYPGTLMQEGAVTPWSITVLGESVFWLAQDNQGRNRMVMATDPAPTVISTPAISYALAQYPITTDAEVLAYEQEGHPFVIWTFPTGDETWGYDVRTQQWHQRDNWNEGTGLSHRWRARGCCVPSGTVGILVGDYETGDTYTLDLDTFQDNGAMIRRCRRAPYLSNENQWLFLDQFEMGIQSGVGLVSGQGSDPLLVLQISRDHTATWTPPITASMGPLGHYLARPRWRQLGRVRADSLVVQVTQTDPVRAVWGPGAWLRATPGSGQL